MSMFDVTALFSRFFQQVSNGASRAGNWTRGQVLNIRRKRPKSAEAAASTATATAPTTSSTSQNTQKATNGESSKRQSKR